MTISRKKVIDWGVWGTLFCGYPFVFTYIVGIPSIPLIVLGSMILCFLSYRINVKLEKEYIILLQIMLVFFSILIVYHSDFVFLSSIVQIIIIIILLALITSILSIDFFIKQYVKVITIITVIGALGAVIVFIFNTPCLFQYHQQDGRLANVYLFTITNTPGPPIAHPVIRYSGVFDEPGALAFFCMIALCLNKVNIKNKYYEGLLLYVPLLTFSVAHIVTLIIYIFLFKIKRIKGYFFATLLILSGASLIYSLKGTQYHQIYTLSVERFETNETGSIKGNSRATESENAYNAFVESPLMGIGIDLSRKVHNNYLSNLAIYGIIGYVFVQIVIFYFMIKFLITKGSSDRSMVLKCMFILLINLQQRPFNTNIMYFLSIMLLIISSNNLLFKKNRKKPFNLIYKK